MKAVMYANLAAEQAKRGMTDNEVAEKIGICRATYAQQKKLGRFRVKEATKLCKLFDCSFEYLFMTDKEA